MPGEGDREKFKRDVVEGSELNYVRKMIYFYSSMLDDLSKKIGEESGTRKRDGARGGI